MKKILLTLVIWNLIFDITLCQPSITWQRTYGWQTVDYAKSIVQTPDNGYIVTGRANFNYMFIMRLDQFGDTVWTRFFPWGFGIKIERTKDNNYIACSYYKHVVKININGNVLWTGGPYDNNAYTEGLAECPDGGYILCGKKDRTPGTDTPYLLKITSTGGFQWDTTYTEGIFDGNFEDIVLTIDNGFVMAGNYSDINYITDKLFVMKTDNMGNQIWFHGFDTLRYCYARSMFKSNNESYIITGDWGSNQPYLTKLNSSGSMQWFKLYYTFYPKLSSCYSVTNTFDGGYALTGTWDSVGNYTFYIFLLKTDSSGNQNWYKGFGFNDADGGYEIRQTSDSGYVIAGYRGRYNGGDIYVIKTDKNGYANPIAVKSLTNHVPLAFKLYQNYPNPFNPVTIIKFEIPPVGQRHSAGGGFDVKLILYDVLGREVAVLVNELLSHGTYQVKWDGSGHPSGVYFYKLIAEEFSQTKKMILIK